MGIATTTMAGKPGNITEAEMAMIPAYCPYTQSFSESRGSPEAKRWESLMGKDFWAMHHYCWAQINQQRAMRSSMSENGRKALLNVARGDYVYVINSAARNFVLLPEVYTRAGEVELRLSLYREANHSFAKARALKPDYWPAYSHWAEFLMYSGKKAEAKQLVKSGLEYSPNVTVHAPLHLGAQARVWDFATEAARQAKAAVPAEQIQGAGEGLSGRVA